MNEVKDGSTAQLTSGLNGDSMSAFYTEVSPLGNQFPSLTVRRRFLLSKTAYGRSMTMWPALVIYTRGH